MRERVQRIHISSPIDDDMEGHQPPAPHLPQPVPQHQPQAQKEESFLALMSDLAQNTGMHGVPNIQRSRGIFRRALWFVVVLCGFGMMIWKVSEAFDKYYSYPSATSITFYAARQLDFPAVAICNLNPIRRNALMNWADSGTNSASDQLRNLLWAQEMAHDESNIWTNKSDRQPSQDWDAKEATVGDDYYDSDTSEFDFLESYMTFSSEMSAQEKYDVGYKLDDMLLDCTYNGRPCSPRNFTKFYNYLYGNCYDFNAAGILKTSKIGPLYGLRLELFVDQDNYISSLADAAGFRVIIHNQTQMPFPEDDGFTISPGVKTSVGIRKTLFHRLEQPYGFCKNYSTGENEKISSYVTHGNNTLEYSEAGCSKTCFQSSLVEKCGCYDARFPFDTGLKVFEQHQESCVAEIEDLYKFDRLACSARCSVECDVSTYTRTTSMAMYPATVAEGDVLDVLADHSDALFDQLYDYGEDVKETYIRDNVAILEVYFEDLKYELVNMKPSYLSLDLISDLGGQGGLWLGLSIIAFFEVFELIVDVVTIVHHKWAAKKQVKSSHSSLKDLAGTGGTGAAGKPGYNSKEQYM